MAVLLFDEVELFDVAGACSVLTAAGRQWNFRPFKIHTVGPRTGLVETRSQVRVEARFGFADVPTPEVIVVPGGYGARRALTDTALLDWLRRAGPAASHLVGVGNGVLLLGAASLLSGVTVAAPRDLEVALQECCPTAVLDHDSRMLQSGKVFTSPTSAAQAALALVSAVLGAKQAKAAADALGVSFAAGSPGSVAILDDE